MTGENDPGRPGPPSGADTEQALQHAAQQIQELVQAQGRMNSLLEAVLALSQDLELSAVLHRVVTTAMVLVGARYGALGVLREEGRGLSQFIPVGLSEEEIEDLAGVEYPTGQGLLGRMIHQREPLRVQEIGAHPDSAGFPPGHPPMRTLLGVAIGVRGRVYGNLYLSTRRDGLPFDTQDEEVVTALAGAAAVVVARARSASPAIQRRIDRPSPTRPGPTHRSRPYRTVRERARPRAGTERDRVPTTGPRPRPRSRGSAPSRNPDTSSRRTGPAPATQAPGRPALRDTSARPRQDASRAR